MLFRENPRYFIVTVPAIDLRRPSVYATSVTIPSIDSHINRPRRTHRWATATAQIHDHGERVGVRSRRARRCTTTAEAQIYNHGADARSRQQRRHTTMTAAGQVFTQAFTLALSLWLSLTYRRGVQATFTLRLRLRLTLRYRLRYTLCRYTIRALGQIHGHGSGAGARAWQQDRYRTTAAGQAYNDDGRAGRLAGL